MTHPADAPPPQRRNNGLRADQFVALADVEPRLGEHLLDLLRLADIAAYLEPTADARLAYRYGVSGPIERLYVQADLRRAARGVVIAAAHEAGGRTPPPQTGPTSDLLSGMDTDAEFARIIAGMNNPVQPSAPPPALAAETPLAQDVDVRSAAAAPEQQLAASPAEQDDDEHFVPPPAPPFPTPSARTVGAFCLFVLGLVVIARGDWVGLGSTTSFPLGVVFVLTAAVLWIRGLPDTPEEPDTDDGAVV